MDYITSRSRSRKDTKSYHARRKSDIDSKSSSDVTSQESDSRTRSTITCFEITFDRHSARYYEGEEIGGKVTLDLKEDFVIDTLVLDFCGSAVVDWLKNPKDNNHEYNHTEKHLNQIVTLYSRTGGSTSDIIVPAGLHEYFFKIQLPYNLPSSFDGDHGHIRYRAKAIIKRPWQPMVTTEKEFTVYSTVDLNTMPQIMAPVQCHKTSSPKLRLSCYHPGSCLRDNFFMTWRLDRTGYVPGETIRINGEVHNEGSTRIRKTRVTLVQHVEYVDISGHALRERKQVAVIEKGPIKPGHIGFWREVMLLPALPPTGFKECTTMNMWYALKFKVVPYGITKPLDTSIEIIIGTVPISRNIRGAIATLSEPYLSNGFDDSETRFPTTEYYNYFV